MPKNCLVGCIPAYAKPTEWSNDFRTFPAATMSPYVSVTFGNRGQEITVGNKSAPGYDNHAVIKSFEYGSSDGQVCKVEIVDEQGGSFNQFFDKLAKKVEDATDLNRMMHVKFGWLRADCNGRALPPIINEIPLQFVPIDAQVSFAEGKVKYIITAPDPLQAVFVARSTATLGTDIDPMGLQDAIRKVFAEGCPKIDKVEFLRSNLEGTPTPFQFNKQYKDKWTTDGQNKLSAVNKWIRSFRTTNDKGVTPTWDSTTNTLIFWEDVLPGPNENDDNDARNIGTYIVNGGNCSNVISFSPTVNWIAAVARFSTGGNSGGSVRAGVIDNQTDEEKEGDCKMAGLQESHATTAQESNQYGFKAAGEEGSKSNRANIKAQSIHTEGLVPIEAELRIQGEPRKFSDIRKVIGRTVSVVVINPFYLRNTNDRTDWLAEPPCNDTLSDRNYMITGVNHSIREGSFVTTLKLQNIRDQKKKQ